MSVTSIVKEKAELIIQMEKISKVKDELTAELETVSNQLQQERSKVTSLTDMKKTAVQTNSSLRKKFPTFYLYFISQTYKKRTDSEK